MIANLQAEPVTASTLASVEKVERELRAFVRRDVALHLSREETWDRNAGLGPAIERMSSASISEIERVMAELASLRDLLRSEAARMHRDLETYAATTKAAMDSMKIIADSLVKWKYQASKPSEVKTS